MRARGVRGFSTRRVWSRMLLARESLSLVRVGKGAKQWLNSESRPDANHGLFEFANMVTWPLRRGVNSPIADRRDDWKSTARPRRD